MRSWLLNVALAALVTAILLSSVIAQSTDHLRRDTYTFQRAATRGGRGPHLRKLGPPPSGSRATTFAVGTSGAEVFAWRSDDNDDDEHEATDALIILHGVKRNADVYYEVLDRAWDQAQARGLVNSTQKAVRVAPLFFSAHRDRHVLNASTLAWDEPNAWTGGDGSVHPDNSNISAFTVLDTLLDHFSDRTAYPNVQRITFLAHGGGAQVIQRYAVLGKEAAADGPAVRYVVGDPSSMLYFTRDRPVHTDTKSCPGFNDFRYGLENYTAPFELAGDASFLFNRYLERDVRYVVGLEDTRDKGDQLCGGRAAGGTHRKNRSLNYWAYLHLLAGIKPVPKYPGHFPGLESHHHHRTRPKSSHRSSRPKSHKADLAAFRDFSGTFAHQLFTVSNAGHNASKVFGSSHGQQAVFGDANSSSSSTPTPSDSSSASTDDDSVSPQTSAKNTHHAHHAHHAHHNQHPSDASSTSSEARSIVQQATLASAAGATASQSAASMSGSSSAGDLRLSRPAIWPGLGSCLLLLLIMR
ncbi:unnamed protein product [Jaminaea pallidilutea]